MFGFGNEKEEMGYLKYELEIQSHKVWKKRTLTQMCRYQHKDTKIMKNHANRKLPTETNKVPITDPKEMEMCELSDKEFKMILSRKLSKLQENTTK